MQFKTIAQFIGPKGTTRFLSYTGTIKAADITTEHYSTGGYYTEKIGNTVYHRDDYQVHTDHTSHLQIVDQQGEISSFKFDPNRMYCTVGNEVTIYAIEDSAGGLEKCEFVNNTTRKSLDYQLRGPFTAFKRRFDPVYWLLTLLVFAVFILGIFAHYGHPPKYLLPALGGLALFWIILTSYLRTRRLGLALGAAIFEAKCLADRHPDEVVEIPIHVPSNSRCVLRYSLHFLRKMWRAAIWTMRCILVLFAIAALSASYGFIDVAAQQGKMKAFAKEGGFDTVFQLPLGAGAKTQRYFQAAIQAKINPESLRTKIINSRAGVAVLGFLRATKGLDAAQNLSGTDSAFVAITKIPVNFGRAKALELVVSEEVLTAMYYAGSQRLHQPLPPKSAYEYALQRSAKLWFDKGVGELSADEFYFAYIQADKDFSRDKDPFSSKADAFSVLFACNLYHWPDSGYIATLRKRYFSLLGEPVPVQWPSGIWSFLKRKCRK